MPTLTTSEENDNSTITSVPIPYPSPPPIHTNLKPRSVFYPIQNRGSHIEKKISFVASEFRKINRNTTYKNNITKNKRNGLNSLVIIPILLLKELIKGAALLSSIKKNTLRKHIIS